MAKFTQNDGDTALRNTTQITAPQPGHVIGITNQTGQAIKAGQVLAGLIPAAPHPLDKAASVRKSNSGNDQDVEVHLFAPSRSTGFVTEGQKVFIRYAAYPHQKYGLHSGIISEVSKTPFAVDELPPRMAGTILSRVSQNGRNSDSNEALYRIKVRLDRQTINFGEKFQRIKPGMTLEADVLQEKRKIWEWIFDPINALSQGK